MTKGWQHYLEEWGGSPGRRGHRAGPCAFEAVSLVILGVGYSGFKKQPGLLCLASGLGWSRLKVRLRGWADKEQEAGDACVGRREQLRLILCAAGLCGQGQGWAWGQETTVGRSRLGQVEGAGGWHGFSGLGGRAGKT